ncbi:MAG TPA: TonB-dependent receptor [Deltaproteobacteria bacterium]|nr:TonB-dependent receptor [Deltaproteobacteria bacterium]
MKKSRLKVVLCGSLVAVQLCGVSAYADQQNTQKIKQTEDAHLGQTVVTATRTEKDLDDVPGSVAVVTKEDMEKLNVATVDDALKGTAGVMLSRSKGMMDQMADITLRGISGQNRTLVMVDGIVLNSPFSGKVLSSSIAPGSLEQIEVVKGASSSLYGGYAMAGAINMITRMPTKREFSLQTGFGSALEGAGEENKRRVAVSYGDVIKDKFKIYINNDYTGTDGYVSDYATGTPGAGTTGAIPTLTNKGAATYILGHKGMSGAWQNNLTLKAEYAFSASTKLRFTFLKSYSEYFYNNPQTYMTTAAGAPYWGTNGSQYSFLGSFGENDQYIYNLALETELSSAKVKMNVGFLDQVSSWHSTPSSSTAAPVATTNGGPGKLSSTPASAFNADIQVTLPVSTWNLLTVGGAFRRAELNGTDYVLASWLDQNTKGQIVGAAKGTDQTYAIFMQDEISILDNLTAYAGFRQDWWETSDGYSLASNSSNVVLPGYPQSFATRSADSFSPKGALVYKPLEKTTIKLAGGKSFRAPTNFELYRTTRIGSSTYYNSPDLKPETNLSWDASVSQGLWQGANIKVTYFENYISDMIYTTASGTSRYRRNAGKGESKGVEMEAEQRFGKLARLFVNYTYTDAKIVENSAVPASVGKRMTDVPEHMFNLGGDLEYGPFGASFVGRYVGKRYGSDINDDTVRGVPGAYDPYFVGDVKLSYKINKWASVSFAVNNLWDEQYYSNTLAPGRSCYGDLTFKF